MTGKRDEKDEGFLHSFGKTIKEALYEEIPDGKTVDGDGPILQRTAVTPPEKEMGEDQAALYRAVAEDLQKTGDGSLYYKFTETLLNLQSIIPDEQPRYKAALAALKLDLSKVVKDQQTVLA